MIRLPATPSLSPAQQFGLDVLIDASRLVPTRDLSADVVQLVIVEPRTPLTVALLAHPESLYVVSDGVVSMSRDVLEFVARVAGAVADQETARWDRYGRTPADVNALVREGTERTPMVSEAGVALRKAVARAAGRRRWLTIAPWPEGRRWAVAFSHDVDVVALWPLFTGARVLELARKGEMRQAGAVFGAALWGVARDQVVAGVRFVLAVEREFGIHSTWFIICGVPTFASFVGGDVTYRASSHRGRKILSLVKEGGHEIGLHGSFATMLDGEVLCAERARLEAIADTPVTGVRQHFLRIRPGVTEPLMVEAGFHYDASLGFSDRNGFRLGVCDGLPRWSSGLAAELPLFETPLHWMDRALSKYQGTEDPARWTRDALDLAARARACEGLWTGLWHPNLIPALGFPKAPEAYRALVAALMTQEPHVATLGEIVEWRRARRSVRAIQVGERSVALTASQHTGCRLVLENRDGKPEWTQAWPAPS